MAVNNFNISDISDAFKEEFSLKSLIQYNNANVVWAKIPKSFDFVSRQKNIGLELAAGGGFGTGSLPTANYSAAEYDQANITAKKVYSVVEIDREAMKAKNSKGVFDVSALEHVAKKGVKVAMRNMQRILFGDSDGALYTGNASNTNVSGSGTACSPYVISTDGDADEFNKHYFEVGDLVNVNSETTDLEVTARSASSISLVGTSSRLCTLSGANPFDDSDVLYMQNSKDNDPQGLEILTKTSGTTYGVSHTNDRFQGTNINAAGAGISEDLLNELVLTIEEESGEAPDLIVASYRQYRKIKNFLADQKTVEILPRDEKLIGKVSFSALQFMSAAGPIAIVADRMVLRDRVYAINTNKIEAIHKPDWGWFDEDGTIFLRRDTSDRYQARYGGYMEIFIQPNFHGLIDELA